MNDSPSQDQGQHQRQPGQDINATPGQQRADHAPDITPPASEEGGGTAPNRDDGNRTPWQGEPPPRQHRGTTGNS